MVDELCNHHSGCVSDIAHLKEAEKELWKEVDRMRNVMNSIFGGVIVSLILLLVNIVLTVSGNGAQLP